MHSHHTPKRAPACAMASQLFFWDVRNKAKINPKLIKKQPISGFFKFLKHFPMDLNKTVYSHSTPKQSPTCALASKLYGWNLRNIAKISTKWPKTVIFRLFLFSQKHSIRFERIFLQSFYTIIESYVINGIKLEFGFSVFSNTLYCLKEFLWRLFTPL